MRVSTIAVSFVFVIGSVLVAAQNKSETAPKTCVIEIADMACSSCAATIQKALLKMDGVKAAEVSQPAGTASVTYDSTKTNPDMLAKAITKKTGFSAKARADR